MLRQSYIVLVLGHVEQGQGGHGGGQDHPQEEGDGREHRW